VTTTRSPRWPTTITVGLDRLRLRAPVARESRNPLSASEMGVERILKGTARDTACPAPEPFTYPWTPAPAPEDYTATCEGKPRFTGSTATAIIDALAAVGGRGH
jgi:hypothetical protein